MCFPGAVPLAMAVMTSGISLVATKMQTNQANNAAMAQYGFQQKQASLVAQNAQSQAWEQTSRQHVEGMRQAESAQGTAQQSMLENLRRQATAQASSATAGITGEPLSTLFNDYQVASGNISSNLLTQYNQINQNQFFGAQDNQMEAQSRINAAQPAPPLMVKWSPLPSLLSGVTAGISSGIQRAGQSPRAGSQSVVPAQGMPQGPVQVA